MLKRNGFAQKVAKGDIRKSLNFSNSFRNYAGKVNEEIYHTQFDAPFEYNKFGTQAKSQTMENSQSNNLPPQNGHTMAGASLATIFQFCNKVLENSVLSL